MFQTKIAGKIKTPILCSIIALQKPCCSGDNVKKYGRARQDTDDNIMLCRMDAICMSTKARVLMHTNIV